MPNLRISLVQENPNQAYYARGVISGNVLLDIDELKSYKQISVRFTGRSYVNATPPDGKYSYTSSETYGDLIASLWSSQQSPDGKLAPGQYSWPFRFDIPPTAPSAFEGTARNIRYSLVGGSTEIRPHGRGARSSAATGEDLRSAPARAAASRSPEDALLPLVRLAAHRPHRGRTQDGILRGRIFPAARVTREWKWSSCVCRRRHYSECGVLRPGTEQIE